MGNLQSSELLRERQLQSDDKPTSFATSPFILRPYDVPSQPFAVQKNRKSLIPRRVEMHRHDAPNVSHTMTEQSSATSPSRFGTNIRVGPLATRNFRSILQQLIELQDWQRVLCRIELYPEEINTYMAILIDDTIIHPVMTSFNNPVQSHSSVIFVTPMHLVCALNPPLLVVATMIRLGGPDTASMPILPRTTSAPSFHRKQYFWQPRRKQNQGYRHWQRRNKSRNTKIQTGENDIDDRSSASNHSSFNSAKWPIVHTSSTDSSNWSQKINFRFSFDDYKRRVKYAVRHRRSRGGAFPMVEEVDEGSCDDQLNSNNRLEHEDRIETQPSSILTGKIFTATTADCSQSHQSSISSTTPPRSYVSDQHVILQLSSTGGVHPLPLRMVQNTTTRTMEPTTNLTKLKDQGSENLSTGATPLATNVHHDRASNQFRTKSTSSVFRVQWDFAPLILHVLNEGSLLPLHVASLYSSSTEVLRILVDAYPLAALSDVVGMLPIHFVAAGWSLPPLLPAPHIAVLNQHLVSDESDAIIGTTFSSSDGPLERLKVLQHAVPDSLRIRSGNNGMTPEEYIIECMEDGAYKDSCLCAIQEWLKKDRSKDSSRMFDIDTSMSTSSDDIFDFNDSLNNSSDDGVTAILDIERVPSTGMESSFQSLSSLVAARDWDRIFFAIKAHPSLAAKWLFGIDDGSASIYKRLPLHCACVYGGPADLISMLIEFYPEGVQTIDPTDMSTPLSLACFANASTDIIRSLLSIYPKAINIVNVYGQVPLHVALLSKAPYDTIELLVDNTPHLVLLTDNDGKTSLDYAKSVYGEKHTVYQLLLVVHDILLTEKINC